MRCPLSHRRFIGACLGMRLLPEPWPLRFIGVAFFLPLKLLETTGTGFRAIERLSGKIRD
jgi:hypothetical protein